MGFDPKLIIDLLHKYKSGTLTVEEDGITRNWVGQLLENQAFFNDFDQDDEYFNHLHEDAISRLQVFEEVKRRTGDLSTAKSRWTVLPMGSWTPRGMPGFTNSAMVS